MANNTTIFNWKATLTDTYQEMLKQFVEHIPQLVAALLLLLVGWLLAHLFRIISRKTILALETILPRTTKTRDMQSSTLNDYAKWGGDIVFWGILLFFIAASANMLQWKLFSGMSGAMLSYLPNLFTGMLIILAGFALSGLVRSAIERTISVAGLEASKALPRMAQVTVIITAMVIGVEHLGINVAFFTTTLIVIIGVLLAGAALAFGLGAKQFVANVIGAHSSRKHCTVGQRIRLAGVEGILLEITQTALIIDTENGQATIPANLFHELVGEIVLDDNSEGQSSSQSSGPLKD